MITVRVQISRYLMMRAPPLMTWTRSKTGVDVGGPINCMTCHMGIAVPVTEDAFLLFQKHVWYF